VLPVFMVETSGPDVNLATGDHWRLLLASDFTGSAKCHNPQDTIPGSSSQASVRNWSTTPLGLLGTNLGGDLPPRLRMRERERERSLWVVMTKDYCYTSTQKKLHTICPNCNMWR